MNALARLAGAASTTALDPIPYRTVSPITAGQTLSIFGITAVLLVAAAGVLLWARKRGWLRRWSMTAGDGKPTPNSPRVLGQTRLGQASVAFVIEVDGSRFVVVESSRQVNLHALPGCSTKPGVGHG